MDFTECDFNTSDISLLDVSDDEGYKTTKHQTNYDLPQVSSSPYKDVEVPTIANELDECMIELLSRSYGEDDTPVTQVPAQENPVSFVKSNNDKMLETSIGKLNFKERELEMVCQENTQLAACLSSVNKEVKLCERKFEEKEKETQDLINLNINLKVDLTQQQTKFDDLVEENKNLTLIDQVPKDVQQLNKELAAIDMVMAKTNQRLLDLQKNVLENEYKPKNMDKINEIARLNDELFAANEKMVEQEETNAKLGRSLLRATSECKQTVLTLKIFKENRLYTNMEVKVLEDRLKELTVEQDRNKIAQTYNSQITERVLYQRKALKNQNKELKRKHEQLEKNRALINERLAETTRSYDKKSSEHDPALQIKWADIQRANLIKDIRSLRTVLFDTKNILKDATTKGDAETMKNGIQKLRDMYVECAEKDWKKSNDETIVAEEFMDKSCDVKALKWCYELAEMF